MAPKIPPKPAAHPKPATHAKKPEVSAKPAEKPAPPPEAKPKADPKLEVPPLAGKSDHFAGAKLTRVTQTAASNLHEFQSLQKAVAEGAKAHVTGKEILKALGNPKGMTVKQAELLFDAGREVAGRRAAVRIMSNPKATLAQALPSSAERLLGTAKASAEAVKDGGKAAETYLTLTKFAEPEVAARIGAMIGESTTAAEYLSGAMQTGKYVKVLKVGGAGLGGLMTVYDFGRAVETQRDPGTTTRQKVAGWVAVSADAAMFVPFPPVQVAAAPVSVAATAFRDSPHPVQDLANWFTDKLMALSMNIHASGVFK
jgi:hypothetical protein